MSNDDKIIDIETRIAYQDDTIQQLNDVIYRQQQQIDKLEKALKLLLEQFQEMMASTPDKGGNEKPPHY